MNVNQMERAAYIAAHRILTTDLSAPELACPGARRSYLVDAIASIIKGVYEAHSQRFDETTDWWPSASAEITSPELISRARPVPVRTAARAIGGPGASTLR
jgi:hypothetical protein